MKAYFVFIKAEPVKKTSSATVLCGTVFVLCLGQFAKMLKQGFFLANHDNLIVFYIYKVPCMLIFWSKVGTGEHYERFTFLHNIVHKYSLIVLFSFYYYYYSVVCLFVWAFSILKTLKMFSVLKPSQSTLFSGKIYLSKPYGRYLNFTKESFVLFKTIALELVKNKNYLIFIILFTVLVQKYDKYLTWIKNFYLYYPTVLQIFPRPSFLGKSFFSIKMNLRV